MLLRTALISLTSGRQGYLMENVHNVRILKSLLQEEGEGSNNRTKVVETAKHSLHDL